MFGAAPPSKGCQTCTKRKIKCDKTRPACKNCTRGRRTCPGYDAPLRFRDEGSKIRQRIEKSSSKNEQNANKSSSSSPEGEIKGEIPSLAMDVFDQPPVHFDNTKTFGVFRSRNSFNLGQQTLDLGMDQSSDVSENEDVEKDQWILVSRDMDRYTSPDPPLLNQILFSPTLDQNQLFSLLAYSLSPLNPQDSFRVAVAHGQWFDYLSTLIGKNPLLDTSIRAVALVNIGVINNAGTFVSESRPYYSKALRLLNMALQNKELGLSDETLSASALLSFYEMFASDKNASWVRHASGVETLMKLRGPGRHRLGRGRSIFLIYRHILAVEAWYQSKPCMLEAPEWQALGLSIVNDSPMAKKDPQLRAVLVAAENIFIEITNIPRVASELRKAKAPTSDQASKDYAIQRGRQQMETFKKVFSDFTSVLQNIGHAPTVFSTTDPIVTMSYKFSNMYFAMIYNSYWCDTILLDLLLIEVDPDQEHIAQYKKELHDCTWNSLMTYEYLKQAKFFAQVSVVFALKTALLVVQTPAEKAWILERIDEIGKKYVKFARDMTD